MLNITQVMVDEHKLILRMIDLVEKNTNLAGEGKFTDWNFYLDAVDFIRNYADRFHHAKEEDILFKALVKNGMPEENSPVAAMMLAHNQGRAFVRAMESEAQKATAGKNFELSVLSENAFGYVALLREHIDTEDNILYSLAERVLPEEVRPAMVQEYEKAESASGDRDASYYQRLVEKYEV